ncbi:hypothetical protein LAL4801_02446 [Roseibium aggregatum]|uniref:Uncharacterized protein n=1 Tax=Roseibium aggregatum TaxID=187304 RepID=A0A0M6Y2S3_9HYPH|nr:hypothetical protein LAL4801_02446 [Roseibium aggregatum]
MDCRIKPCNDGSWAKHRRVNALYSPTRSPSSRGSTMGSMPLPLRQNAAPAGMVKVRITAASPGKTAVR